ncbi:MAG: hypothetical protein RLZZ360_518 [Candidatus Parcubacteria bacterium]|jgi:hypothetical protein
MLLSSFFDSGERHAEHDKLMVFMRGDDYQNDDSFRILQAASGEIETMAKSVMPSHFIKLTPDAGLRSLNLYFAKGTAYGAQRPTLDELRGWIALFLHYPNP